MAIALKQSKPEQRTEIVTVTPDIAARWLESNTGNRPVRLNHVARLADLMKRHLWLLNGKAIVFDSNGVLIDGQHRLWACIESNVSFDTLVVWNADENAALTYGNEAVRRFSDFLHANGYKEVNQLAATAGFLWEYDENIVDVGHYRPPAETLITTIKRHPTIVDSMSVKLAVRGLRGKVACGLWVIFGEINPIDRNDFYRGLTDGIGLTATSPIYKLRELLLKNKDSLRKAPPHYEVAWCIKSWNMFRNKRLCTALVFRATEVFPRAE